MIVHMCYMHSAVLDAQHRRRVDGRALEDARVKLRRRALRDKQGDNERGKQTITPAPPERRRRLWRTTTTAAAAAAAADADEDEDEDENKDGSRCRSRSRSWTRRGRSRSGSSSGRAQWGAVAGCGFYLCEPEDLRQRPVLRDVGLEPAADTCSGGPQGKAAFKIEERHCFREQESSLPVTD